jgi:hypothetical protein
MAALLGPVNRVRGGIKWSFVAHTLVMFSIVSISTVLDLDVQSISYIDNRKFPGFDDGLPRGPVGYQLFIWLEPISQLNNLPLFVNGLFADGLLVSFASTQSPRCPT